MGLSIGNIASIASAIGGKINVGSLISGINVNNLSPDSINSLKSNVESKLNSVAGNITNEITSSINSNDIESMLKNYDVESKIHNLMGQAGVSDSIDTSQIDSMVNSMMKEFSLSNINSM